MKTVAIIQARMNSTRLPGKVMEEICGIPLINILISRLKKSRNIDQIVLATSDDPHNEKLITYLQDNDIDVYLGSENDVLDRYYSCATFYKADNIVRITGDCPLIDPDVVDLVVEEFKLGGYDYASNINPPSYPDGLDIEIFTYKTLVSAWKNAKIPDDREHVTSYIRESKGFNLKNISNSDDYSNERWTVDEPEDLVIVRNIFHNFSPNIHFHWEEVMELKKNKPKLFLANKYLIRNEGKEIGTGSKLWKRAKRVIPGGNMLLSKRPEMFLPDIWPSYFSRSKGCKVWDLDDNEYIDMSIMSVGTNILGYGNPEVDDAVAKAVKDGNMSTLNCPEEVYLAEKLIELHPWADMVRFARSGGEINSIAVRIARAFTGKDKIAICGYHGWHDWYLSTNLNSDKNLDGHLLPGLLTKGIPRSLVGTTLPFDYNNIEQLEKLIKDNYGEIAAIKMEVSRNEGPKSGYLEKVRELATENNIILIFDECTSGFRETFGGLHKKYDVNPDIAVFAKALGNGYAISACIGREKFMQAAQSTFISSTFWTERIGPSAALKTLEVMEKEQSWNKVTKIGDDISDKWKNLAEKHDLDINTWGIPALSGYTFRSTNALKYKTLITQEMLKSGYLAGNSVYACIKHTPEIINGYFVALDPIFQMIKECEQGCNIDKLLDTKICHNGFSRLN
jgi:glutamate-1-semialdehyde 2,1-aminomutase